MSMMKSLGIRLSIALLGCGVLAQQGLVHGSHQAPSSEAIDKWIEANYDTILEQVFPEQLDLKPFPSSVKWVAVIQIHDAFRASEYWFSMRKHYDGRIEAFVRLPKGGSLAEQLRDLLAKTPNADAQSILSKLRIQEYAITDKNMPELKDLSQAFEFIQMSPVMPDSLTMDASHYHFWSESQYGQQMSATLAGFGPEAPKQPHSLVEWAERARVAMREYTRKYSPEHVATSR